MFGFIEEVRDELNTQGVGMGLHITKSIVTQFGGEVNVRSEVGTGSTFGFTFKLSQLHNQPNYPNRLFNPHIPRRESQLLVTSNLYQD